jgi:hypothetical protein
MSLRFVPGIERTVKAVFWAETSFAGLESTPGLDTAVIPVGKRGFMIDLSHASVWNDVIESVDIRVVLKGGLTFDADNFSAVPVTYEQDDTTITWSFDHLEPGIGDNVQVGYEPSGPWPSATNTMARLSSYIVRKVYGELLFYADMNK